MTHIGNAITRGTIKILQYNVHKGNEITNSILNDPTSAEFTVLLLQEQHWIKRWKSSPLHNSWNLIQPTFTGQRPRSVIYVNRSLNSSLYRTIHLPFNDVTAIAIKTTKEQKPTLIINIYNPGINDEDMITPLQEYLRLHLRTQDYEAIIMAGDFNLHHPLWNPPNYDKQDQRDEPQAEKLIAMMVELGLKPLLPSGTITFPGDEAAGRAGTAIDLVWGNDKAQQAVLKCQIAADNDHGSDHLPIQTLLNLELPVVCESRMPYNYAKTNWKGLEQKIVKNLPTIINTDSATPASIDKFANDITEAIAQAVHDTTPRKCHGQGTRIQDMTMLLAREQSRPVTANILIP
jgi:exonuclease III